MTEIKIRDVLCALVSLAASACMQPAEPTPVSTLVAIAPRFEAVRILGGGTSASFGNVFNVDDLTTRSIFLSDSWDLEKLVDQKWQLAYSNEGSPIGQLVTPQQSGIASFLIIFVRDPPSDNPFFRNVAGIYRVHLRITYADGAKEALPTDQTYTPPFAVVE
jgi:hypothetical protein